MLRRKNFPFGPLKHSSDFAKMIATGFDNDEDDRMDEVPCCEKCGHELGQGFMEDWYCVRCEPEEKE